MSTPLERYMSGAGIGDAEFGSKIGRDRTIVSKMRRGRLKPTLDVAAAIERETGGAVPISSWLAEAA